MALRPEQTGSKQGCWLINRYTATSFSLRGSQTSTGRREYVIFLDDNVINQWNVGKPHRSMLKVADFG